MNLLLSWRNLFAAIQAIDQAVKIVSRVSGGVENNGSVVSSYKYVCLLFNVTFTIVYKYSYHNFMLPLPRNDPVHVGYTIMNIFVHIVFNTCLQIFMQRTFISV